MPIEAIGAAASEWTVPSITESTPGLTTEPPVGIDGGLGGPAGSGPSSGGGFGAMLGRQIENLTELQKDAASASRSLADGSATDPSQVVVAVERAQLAMQLAAQLRTKSVDAISEVMRTQV